jgi:hypothetical protein
LPAAIEINVTVAAKGRERDETLRQLAATLAAVRTNRHAENWVDHDAFPSLCVLVNGAQSWLMCLRYDGDAGFSSRNPSYGGDANAMVEYCLFNDSGDGTASPNDTWEEPASRSALE